MGKKMKIGLINFTPMIYDVDTPLSEPLGGSESALCYLAVALAELGHEVVLFARGSKDKVVRGVRHLPNNKVVVEPLDFLIVQNAPSAAIKIRERLGSRTKILFWSQHAANQPPVFDLATEVLRNAFDKIVLISEWQKQDYINNFPIEENKIVVLKNAISPAFENLTPKKRPWSMAYTSTPFRGLTGLIDIFEEARRMEPRVRLEVFSSMRVYQATSAKEQEYESIYQKCRQADGVDYVGSLPQKELAKRLCSVAILAYPNIFPETSCIAVMEAMAAGCQIVTSNLAALPETTAGFGRLVDITGRRDQYFGDFLRALLTPIDPVVIEKQIKYVNQNYTWKVRAREWEEMLISS